MPHITCADPRRSELEPVIDYYRELGTENVLALRGDPEEYGAELFDGEVALPLRLGLVRFLANYKSFCIGVAVYPRDIWNRPTWGWTPPIPGRRSTRARSSASRNVLRELPLLSDDGSLRAERN
jgi:hypothetical protein